MHVTIAISERVWREFKAECFRRGLKASQLIEHSLREQLRRWGIEVTEEPKKRRERKR